MAIPQPRYKIIERGRRLITIDTLTGAEIGTKAEAPASASAGHGGTKASERGSALTPIVKAIRHTADTPSSDKSGRIGILIAAGIAGVIFLFFTGAWVVVAIALAIPPARAAAFAAAKVAIGRFLDPEA